MNRTVQSKRITPVGGQFLSVCAAYLAKVFLSLFSVSRLIFPVRLFIVDDGSVQCV